MAKRRDGSNLGACAQVDDWLESYADGDLNANQQLEVEEHLRACSACRAELDAVRSLAFELRSMPTLECPDEVVANVLASTRTQSTVASEGEASRFRPAVSSVSRQHTWLRAAAAILVLSAGLIAGLWLLQEAPKASQRQANQTSDTHSRAELEQAHEDLQIALAYFGGIAEKAGLVLRDDVIADQVVRPTRRALSRIGTAESRQQ